MSRAGKAKPFGSINSPVFRKLSFATIGALAIMLGAMIVTENYIGFVANLPFLLFSIYFLRAKRRLPSLFSFLFAISALWAAVGFAYDLFVKYDFYDLVAHTFCGLTTALTVAYMIYRPMNPVFRKHRLLYVATLVGCVSAIGIGWEVFEYFTDLIDTIEDTLLDLVLDMAGAAVGALIALREIDRLAAVADVSVSGNEPAARPPK